MAKVHLIGNAHIDPVWLWRWQEGFSEIRATFRSALDRMKEFPEFKFTSACASYYQWIEKMDPEMFAEIKERVKQGRWSIVGGWFLQPDCNIPCGESFARHGLLSQRYFQEKFGVTAKTGYNVDSFGHNAGLPQILKKSGMDNYVFMRPSVEEQGREEEVFYWESADGSRVKAYRIPELYNIDAGRLSLIGEIKSRADQKDIDMMAFYGVGNHGGGPTIRLLDQMGKLKVPDLVYSVPDQYFAGLEGKELPVLKGELQHHARGCYSACSFVKTSNRKCESHLLAAEKFAMMARHLTGIRYPKKKLEKAWKNVLFNQFHDIMGGCSIRPAYEDAGYLYGEAMSIAEQEINYALQSIAGRIDTLQGETLPSYKEGTRWHSWEHEALGTPVVVFNPHPWETQMSVNLNEVPVKMTDWEGKEIPFQIIRGDQTNGNQDKYHTLFRAEVGAMGYAVYRMFFRKEAGAEERTEESGGLAAETNRLSVTEHQMENDLIRVEFDSVTGDVCRIYDKKAGRDILRGACRALLLDETRCDTWAHNQEYLGKECGYFTVPEFQILERGPVRAVVRITTTCHASTLQRDFILEEGSSGVQVKVKADFHEKHKTLKFAFPAAEKTTTAAIAFGTIVRENLGGEEPCGAWIASGPLAIANDGKYGYDTTEGEVRLTILRGAVYADHYGDRDLYSEYMDQGVHECSYLLYGYTDTADAEKRAQELNFPLRHVMESFHGGALEEKESCFFCESDHIAVTAVKLSEDGEEAVVRFFETEGRSGKVTMELFGKRIETTAAHNEIKTLKADGTEVNLLEW